LFQIKGGYAKFPNEKQRRRLQRAVNKIKVGYDYAIYKKGKPIDFLWDPAEFLVKFH